MNFTYQILRQAEASGDRIGNWKGMPVFACRANNLKHKGSGAYFILYDDENRLVTRVGSGWKSYGEVSEQGSVSKYSSARNYRTPAEAAAAARKAGERSYPTSGMRYSSEPIPQATMTVSYAPEGSYTPGYDRAERPVADVKVEIDVEATLKKAREMTIDDLLDGFMVGVMAVG